MKSRLVTHYVQLYEKAGADLEQAIVLALEGNDD
jgi:hypothetical protein